MDTRSKTLWKTDGTLSREFILIALFIFLAEVQFLCGVEHPVYKNVLFINQGLK